MAGPAAGGDPDCRASGGAGACGALVQVAVLELLHGDCRTVMAGLPAASVDAVVCDPPYGLEFMGKEWDAIGRIGKASHGGFTDGKGFKGFVLPKSYNASSNIKCGRCSKWKWDHEGRKCECGAAAEWPNIKSQQGQTMQEWHHAWAAEALRVAKPGAHLLAFGGTRTFHRLAVAIEDAGWEIRDTVMWVYGSGFPKSHDVGKGIDKAAGAEGERGDYKTPDHAAKRKPGSERLHEGWQRPWMEDEAHRDRNNRQYLPATDAAREWHGWGTSLKPAWEPIIVARKPLEGTVAANVLAHGTGALNIDGCRVETSVAEYEALDDNRKANRTIRAGAVASGFGMKPEGLASTKQSPLGRWPANLIHDGSDEVLAGFPVNAGAFAPVRRGHSGKSNGIYGDFVQKGDDGASYRGDTGSAARFFYCAKASKADRDEGCEMLEETRRGAMVGNVNDGNFLTGSGNSRQSMGRNHHPTVKPTALMRYLCKLVTPPAGTVLDPFMGSGSTGKAARMDGFGFIGIEQDAEYIAIARARIAHAVQSPAQQPLHI